VGHSFAAQRQHEGLDLQERYQGLNANVVADEGFAAERTLTIARRHPRSSPRHSHQAHLPRSYCAPDSRSKALDYPMGRLVGPRSYRKPHDIDSCLADEQAVCVDYVDDMVAEDEKLT
jgi:hypothetical protein